MGQPAAIAGPILKARFKRGKFHAKNATAIADANAQRQSAINQFNSTLSDQRQRFNVENQRIIDQSNTRNIII